ncbi:PAM71-HL [Symbiodinium natans]|uniref:GDT1 family protein n=1 Tax=Symbiodinium natans TaxID=878477 RepID=A0A812KYY2_9DINO|nr:PAM71-HL [Symbiodinium natans]
MNVVHRCTFSMIWWVPLLLAHVKPIQGLSNLAQVRQNTSLAGLTGLTGNLQVDALNLVSSQFTQGKILDNQQQKPTKTGTWYGTLPDNFNVIIRSFSVVAVAELFDKTWFVALICAMNYGRSRAFIGAYVALVVHVLLAAALGVAIAQLFSITVLCFTTATVFFLLALAYFVEFLRAGQDEDVIQGRTDEAQEALQGADEKKEQAWKDIILRVFVAVFVAEWGDRTQVAMVTLHSSAPWVPVCIGSMIAFLVLTLSAVLAASLLEGTKLSEKLVLGLSACSFLLFAALAVRDGISASRP